MTKSLALFLSVFFASTAAFAQLQREQHYPSASLHRSVLDVSGETYVLDDSCRVTLFHADHSFFKNKYLTDAGNAYIRCGFHLLSENRLDNDPDLDVIYGWAADGEDVFGARLEDENSAPLNLNGAGKWLELPGQPLKLLTGSTVWGLPGMALEHNYGYQQTVERKWFELGGERYVVHKDYGGFDGFHFYDAGHNLIKTVNLNLPQFNYLDFVSQTYFNADSLFEFSGITWESDGLNQRTCRIVREDGVSLFELPCFYALIQTLPGRPDYFSVVRFTAPNTLETQLRDPQTLTLLASLPGQATRRLAGVDEEVFLSRQPEGNNPILCYNSDFQLIKSFEVPQAYGHFWAEGVSRDHFSTSGQLEFWFTYLSTPDETSVAVLRADGQLLYQFPGARQALLDHQDGLKDKFFVYYRDSTVVYDFVNEALDAAVPAETTAWKLAPNPFVDALHIELPDAAGALRVFDGQGRLLGVFERNGQSALDLPTDSWPAGIYWLQWQQGGTIRSAKAVKGQ